MRIKFAAVGGEDGRVRGAEGFAPAGLETLKNRYAMLEEHGYELIGVGGDSHSLYRDMYVGATLAALNSSKAQLFSTVANPVTRHPAVTANAAACINEISGGRFIFNISSGDSGVRNLGLKPARLAEMREYITAFKDLFRNKEATYHGKTIRLMWPEQPVPIWITAEGPKSLELGGELCDGVYVGVGIQPDAVHDALASSANHGFRFTLERKFIPEEYKESILLLQKRYDSRNHNQAGAGNGDILDEIDPKLKYYLADRFAIIGPPDEYIRKIEMLADLGVTQMSVAANWGAPREEQLPRMQRFADEVMSHFR